MKALLGQATGDGMPLTRRMGPLARLMAAALEGDREALASLACSPELTAQLATHRVSPALAARALELGIEGPAVESWQRSMRFSAAHRIRLEASLARIAGVLDELGIPWAPIKGLGAVSALYASPEERPTSDIDILVLPEDLDPARRALSAAGWRAHTEGPRAEAYLRDEGYAWVAMDEYGMALELHHRLWGTVPEVLGREVLERALPQQQPGTTCRQLQAPDTYLVAAVHLWLSPVPRPMLYWWELHCLITRMNEEEQEQIVVRARRMGQPLLVGAAAAVTAELWPSWGQHQVAGRLLGELRAPERLALAVLGRQGAMQASYGTLFLASRLAGRPARSGWRSVLRRIWAHPWTVETSTPGSWPWPLRRLTHTLMSVAPGLLKRWLQRLMHEP